MPFLTLFENPLAELPGLRELWLNSTRLRTLPAAALRPLSGLRAFGLTVSPRLRALPGDALRELAVLRALAPRSNRLAALPGALLRGLDRLHPESLRCHRLRAQPRAFFCHLRGLERVELEHSPLETLPADAFADLPRLAQVRLGHHPWRCDCGLPPRCRGPGPRAGLPLWALPVKDPECPDTRRPPPCPAPAATLPALAPAGSEPEVRAQLGARGPRQDRSLFWGLYFLPLATQAVLTGIIVFAVVKLCRLFRRLIREREGALVRVKGKTLHLIKTGPE